MITPSMPRRDHGPARILGRRLLIALVLIAAMALVTVLDRDGYRDSADGEVDVVDAIYYATVSLSTTGYGDITPVTTRARLVNALLVTPLRVAFLVVLVGTTLEVATSAYRNEIRARRWRRRMRDHVVVVGYGTKGRAAVRALRDANTDAERIVVLDLDPERVARAAHDGVVAICGDAAHDSVLRAAGIVAARRVVVATDRDDTSVLVTLSVRRLNRTATLVAAVRRAENAPLVKDAGADLAVVSDEAAGRLLGVSALSPATGEVVGDLLAPAYGLEILDRLPRPEDASVALDEQRELLVGVVRDGHLHLFGDPSCARVRDGDRVLALRVHPAPRDRTRSAAGGGVA